MKKLLLLSSIFTAALFTAQSAMAEVRLRAGVASATYNLTGDYGKTEAKYHPISLNATYAFDNGMYIDVGYTGGSGTHDGWAPVSPDEKFKRSDVALTFGASKLNQNNGLAGTVYVGLKTGKTELSAPAWYTSTGFSVDKFTTSGLIFGGGISYPIAGGAGGTVGGNIGLGLMGNKWEDDKGYSVKATGAFGGSIGVSYTYAFSDMAGVMADYKIQSYTYNFDNKGVAPDPYVVHEKINALGVSVYVKF